jgi:hypothetical protein
MLYSKRLTELVILLSNSQSVVGCSTVSRGFLPHAKPAHAHPLLPLQAINLMEFVLLGGLVVGHLQPLRFDLVDMLLGVPAVLA